MTTPDGGQAFPILECSRNNITGEMQTFQSSPGLTVRDYLAIHCTSFDPEGDAAYVAKCLDISVPPAGSAHSEWFLWWRKAEALWRYAQADAMLSVR